MGLVGTALVMGAMPFAGEAALWVGLMWALTFPRSLVVPLLDALTLRTLGSDRYDSVRLWGTIGYGLSVGAFGWAVRDMPHAEAGRLAVGFGAALTLLQASLAPWVWRSASASPAHSEASPDADALTSHDASATSPDADVTSPNASATSPDAHPMRLRDMLRNAGLMGLLGVGALHWASIMIFNVFFPLHTRALGHDNAVPGYGVAASIAAEALGFAIARRVLGERAALWLPAIMAAGVVRWSITAQATSAWALIAAQTLHMASFGLWLSATMRLLGRYAPDDKRSSLQGLFFAVVFGFGGVLGSALGGAVMERMGGSGAFWVAASCDGLAMCAALVWVAATRRAAADPSSDTLS